jgi:hypothetical protein
LSTHQLTTSTVRYVEIEGSPGYRIGDDGLVQTSRHADGRGRYHLGPWKTLKSSPLKSGHMRVSLGNSNERYVHVLVLNAFVGPCPEGMECRHLDGNPGNNHLWNLAWGTRKENYEDSVRHGTAVIGIEQFNRVLDETDVRAIVGLCQSGQTMDAVAGKFGVHPTNVHAIMTGRSWSTVTGFVYSPKASSRKGEKRDKLTDEQVAIIKARTFRYGEASKLAREWGVSGALIRMIAKGQRRA